MAEQGMSQMTTWRMRIACWITEATDTLSEYVIFIAFPRQQWLRERASVLRYTYIAALVLPSEILKYSDNKDIEIPSKHNRLIILYHLRATCFDSLESSSGPLMN